MTTPNIGLELPAQGADNWHIPNNSNFTIIDTEVGNVDIAIGDTNTDIDTNIKPFLNFQGIITLWYGIDTAVPTGWQICDGTNNTPDLRDKFVVGAGTTYVKDATGGLATHTLTINEMPAHTHNIVYSFSQRGDGASIANITGTGINDVTESTGGGAAHNNLPPYHALFYIMKL